MAVRYEWQERRGGRRYVRIVEPDASVKVSKAAVAEVEAVPEIKIEAAEVEPAPVEVVAEPEAAPAPKRGRPKKVVADE